MHDSFLIIQVYEDDLKTIMHIALKEMPFRLFNQSVTKTKIDYEGINFSAFTHLLRKDRVFMIDMHVLNKINVGSINPEKGWPVP